MLVAALLHARATRAFAPSLPPNWQTQPSYLLSLPPVQLSYMHKAKRFDEKVGVVHEREKERVRVAEAGRTVTRLSLPTSISRGRPSRGSRS